MRIIARLEKGESVRYVSHLDIQRLLQRAFRRAGVPLAYSQGFNPHPLLSFATALSVGYMSVAEWLDLKLESPMAPAVFMERINETLPRGFAILEAFEAEEGSPTLSTLMVAAAYTIACPALEPARAASGIEALLSDPIMVEKRTKAGMKTVSIRPMVYAMSYAEGQMQVIGCLDAAGSLNIELLMRALMGFTGDFAYTVRRDVIYSRDGAVFPRLPENVLREGINAHA